MNRKNRLNFSQFLAINSKLIHISDTWSNLWVLVFYTRMSVGRLIDLQYKDIDGHSLLLREHGRLKEQCIELTTPVEQILERRRKQSPDDIYVFQSHSNRVKISPRPVTVIAFNAALRKASRNMPGLKMSSSSARSVSKQ